MSRKTPLPVLEILTLCVVIFACVIALVPGADLQIVDALDSLRRDRGASLHADDSLMAVNNKTIESEELNREFDSGQPSLAPPERIASRLDNPISSNTRQLVLEFQSSRADASHQPDTDELTIDSWDADPENELATLASEKDAFGIAPQDDPDQEMIQLNDHQKLPIVSALPPSRSFDDGTETKSESINSLENQSLLATLKHEQRMNLKPRQTVEVDQRSRKLGVVKNSFIGERTQKDRDVLKVYSATRQSSSVVKNRFFERDNSNFREQRELGTKRVQIGNWEFQELPAIHEPKPARGPMTSEAMLRPNDFIPID